MVARRDSGIHPSPPPLYPTQLRIGAPRRHLDKTFTIGRPGYAESSLLHATIGSYGEPRIPTLVNATAERHGLTAPPSTWSVPSSTLSALRCDIRNDKTDIDVADTVDRHDCRIPAKVSITPRMGIGHDPVDTTACHTDCPSDRKKTMEGGFRSCVQIRPIPSFIV